MKRRIGKEIMADNLPFNEEDPYKNLPEFYTPRMLKILEKDELIGYKIVFRDYPGMAWEDLHEKMIKQNRNPFFIQRLQDLHYDVTESGLSEEEYVVKDILDTFQLKKKIRNKYPNLGL